MGLVGREDWSRIFAQGHMVHQGSSGTFEVAVIYPQIFTDLLGFQALVKKKKKNLEDELRFLKKVYDVMRRNFLFK